MFNINLEEVFMDSELSSQENDAAIDSNNQNSRSKNYWFVGAFYNEEGDQTTYFIENGIWQNGYDDKYLDLVRSIQSGGKIAIYKNCFNRIQP